MSKAESRPRLTAARKFELYLATREADPSARIFTLEELIAHPLPDVSDYPIYTWAGPKIVPPKHATSLD